MPGPPALRAEALLREARSWAAQVDSRLADAYVTMAEGTIAFLRGRWRDSLALCDAAERIFRDDCVGVAWEIGTAYRMSLTALWHMGRIAELGRRLGRALDEADRRGDLYAATQLRTVLQPNLCLMEDREAAARAELARAEAGLTQRETTMQHWQHMQASALVELYTGAPARAVELMDRRLPAMRRAFLLRVQAIRNFTMFVRVAGWLGTLADGAPDADRLVASIARACAEVAADPEPGTAAAVQLVRAELAVLHGDLDTAAAGYRAAATHFDAADMALVAEAARWRLGELTAGDDGRALIARATAALRTEGIVRPDRVIAMFVPVPHDARLAKPRPRSRKARAR
jgi:hypothetical protein